METYARKSINTVVAVTLLITVVGAAHETTICETPGTVEKGQQSSVKCHLSEDPLKGNINYASVCLLNESGADDEAQSGSECPGVLIFQASWDHTNNIFSPGSITIKPGYEFTGVSGNIITLLIEHASVNQSGIYRCEDSQAFNSWKTSQMKVVDKLAPTSHTRQRDKKEGVLKTITKKFKELERTIADNCSSLQEQILKVLASVDGEHCTFWQMFAAAFVALIVALLVAEVVRAGLKWGISHRRVYDWVRRKTRCLEKTAEPQAGEEEQAIDLRDDPGSTDADGVCDPREIGPPVPVTDPTQVEYHSVPQEVN